MYNLINLFISTIIFLVIFEEINSINDFNFTNNLLPSISLVCWLVAVLITQKYKRSFNHPIFDFINPYVKTYLLLYIFLFLTSDNFPSETFLTFIVVDLVFFISVKFLIHDVLSLTEDASFYSKEKTNKKQEAEGTDDKKFNFISEFTSKEELIKYIKNGEAFNLILNPHNGAEDKSRRQGNILLFDQLMNDCKNINFNLKTYFDASSSNDYFLFFYKPIEFEKERNQLTLYKSLIHRFLPMIPYLKKIYLYLTGGCGRLISRAEMWGRLHYNGFEVIEEHQLSEIFCVACSKASISRIDTSPSYYPLISLNRVGFQGRIISIYKLRSMYPYSEFIQKKAFDMFDLTNTGKINNDFRITDYGHFIRKYWLDELPQILNWFRGDIKLVGIRAMSLHYFSLYPKRYQEKYKAVKPGILSPIFDESTTTFNDIVLTEEKYLDSYLNNFLLTDIVYFWKILGDILFRGIRST